MDPPDQSAATQVDESVQDEAFWTARRTQIKSKILSLIESIVETVAQGRLPSLQINDDSWATVNINSSVLQSNNTYTKCCNFKTLHQVERFARLMVVFKTVYSLLDRNEVSTVRQIFYENEALFKKQVNLSSVLNDATKILRCTRRDLNVVATAKGLIKGNIRWRIKGSDQWIDCRPTSVIIPNDLRNIENIETEANLILIVEKDAIFQKLLDQDAINFLASYGLDVLLVTGKGVPDLCTRQLIHILHTRIVPDAKLLVLTDADAFGIEIAGIYSFGSLATAFTENYGVPKIRWIGLFPSEIELYNMSPESRIRPPKNHRKRLQNLLTRPWMELRPEWYSEVLKLTELGCKAEIQALDQFGYNFLLKNYILRKISDDMGAFLNRHTQL